MNHNQDLSLLEQYIRGELSDEQVRSIEKRLLANSDLRTLLTEIKDRYASMRFARLQSTFQNIQSWEKAVTETSIDSIFEEDLRKTIRWEKQKQQLQEIKSFESENKKNTLNLIPSYWWGMVAGIVFLLAVGWYYLLPSSGSSNQLIAKYCQPSKAIGIDRGISYADEKKINQALLHYNAGQYEKAIPILEYFKNQERGETLAFYLGTSYLLKNQPKQTINLLLDYKKFPSHLQLEAQWHLALAYWAEGKSAEAITILETLTKEPSLPKEYKVRQLLKKLRME